LNKLGIFAVRRIVVLILSVYAHGKDTICQFVNDTCVSYFAWCSDGQRTGQHQALSKKEKISKVKISLI